MTFSDPKTSKKLQYAGLTPYSAPDVVEVIACTKPSELHKQFAQHAAKAEPDAPFQTLTRRMAVNGIDKSVAAAPESSDAPPRWSQDSVIVSTFPKP